MTMAKIIERAIEHPLEKGELRSIVEKYALKPKYLEYSEKDDKFRLIGTGRKYGDTINLGRITACEPYTKEYTPRAKTRSNKQTKVVEFELFDERKALERAGR